MRDLRASVDEGVLEAVEAHKQEERQLLSSDGNGFMEDFRFRSRLSESVQDTAKEQTNEVIL